MAEKMFPLVCRITLLTIGLYHLDLIVNVEFYRILFYQSAVTFYQITLIGFAVTLALAIVFPQRWWVLMAWFFLYLNHWFFLHFGYGADSFVFILLFSIGLMIHTKGHGFKNGRLLLTGQLVVIYFYTGFSKLLDPEWTSGGTLAKVLHLAYGIDVPSSGILSIVALAIAGVQLFSPLMFCRSFRIWILGAIGAIHLGAILFLPFFSLLCLEALLLVGYAWLCSPCELVETRV